MCSFAIAWHSGVASGVDFPNPDKVTPPSHPHLGEEKEKKILNSSAFLFFLLSSESEKLISIRRTIFILFLGFGEYYCLSAKTGGYLHYDLRGLGIKKSWSCRSCGGTMALLLLLRYYV